MGTLALIGFIGGLITGISPCILPVLPVIFLASGAGREAAPTAGAVVTAARTRAHPYLVIAGLVLSFAAVTLLGSALLSALNLPQDLIRWIGLIALAAVGAGLIFPRIEVLLEKPFALIPQRAVSPDRGGFVLGLALGAVYVPCAGPVLAAIAVAGSTATIGVSTVVLTLSFSVGAALPLLMFALAGQRVSQRVKAFRRHQRAVRLASGVVIIALAAGLVLDLPAAVQRAIPDYTSALQDRVNDAADVPARLGLGGLVNEENKDLGKCANGARQLQSCGTAPSLTGITKWLNTPGEQAITLQSLRGKVVLIDFWAYSCINCQRSIPHVVGWYDTYRKYGLEVIGVHSPEYAFEKETRNVIAGASRLNIKYPVAQDNNLSTWTNYRNQYWPAHYLIDAKGTVRHLKFGEGGYGVTEDLIRQLLREAGAASLPSSAAVPDNTPQRSTTAETYLSVGKQVNYGGPTPLEQGEAEFSFPAALRPDSFALQGRWNADYQGVTAVGENAAIRLNYHARQVFLVVGGQGAVTVEENGGSRRIPVSGPPTLYEVHRGDSDGPASLTIRLSPGMQAFSFTFG